MAQLVNRKGNGILQLIKPIEDELMRRGIALVNDMRNEKKDNKKKLYKTFVDYYAWADGFIQSQYEMLFK